VYRAVAADTGHPTAESVYARLRTEMSSLSLATVYRILEFLEAEGLVRRVSTTNSAGRFDANLSRHQHLVCRICGRMTDYEQVPLARLHLSQIAPSGFEVEELDIRLLGRCESCKSAASTGRRIQPKPQYR
jgi:Fur family peroxide stress response transcriptional regulator